MEDNTHQDQLSESLHVQLDVILLRLAKSSFRSRFKLNQSDLKYLQQRDVSIIMNHAHDFLVKRLAPANPHNDGRQTPMRGHPAFVAQHATATCCRSCMHKWHKIPKNQPLTQNHIKYACLLIEKWLLTQAPNLTPPTDRHMQITQIQQLEQENCSNPTRTLFDNLLQ